MRVFSIIGLLFGAGLLAYFAMTQVNASKASASAGDAASASALARSVDKAKQAVALENVESVRRAVNMFKAQENRLPESLEQLVAKGMLSKVPEGLTYDPSTGEVRP
jgi:hypothetical protein